MITWEVSKLVKKHQFDDAIELTKLRNPNDRNVYIFIIKALIEESEVDMAMALLRQTSEKFTLINAVGSLINHGFYNFAKETIGRMEDEQDIELYTCANESNHLYGLDSMMCPETSSVHICYLSYKY